MNSIINFLLTNTPLLYWTQSLWRDEAFSVWIAQDSLAEVIKRTSGDFNPPLYYLLLNIWMKIFGESEIALRGLSVFFFLLFLIVVHHFALRVFKSVKMAQITTMLMALNPMLLYHAFELRMYSLLCLWTALSMYFLYTKQWRAHILVSALGLYTQPFMAFVVFAQSSYLLFTKQFKRMIFQLGGIGLLFLPWVPTLITQFKASGPMWMYPVDLNLVTSVLGNLFMGYEGTPGGLWIITKLITLLLVGITLLLWRKKALRQELLLSVFWVYIPVILILVISLVKPIYVHRYLIYATIGEVFLVCFFIAQLVKTTQTKVAVISIITLILTNLFATSFHRKVTLQNTFNEVNSLLSTTDAVYADSPLVYYETLYYTRKNVPVKLYNPEGVTMPRYVGSIGMPESVWANSYPVYPKRAFLISEKGTYTIVSNLQQ